MELIPVSHRMSTSCPASGLLPGFMVSCHSESPVSSHVFRAITLAGWARVPNQAHRYHASVTMTTFLRTVAALAVVTSLTLAGACLRKRPERRRARSPKVPAFEARLPFWEAVPVSNYRPGVAIFDYDRDGDFDFYITQQAERPNRLFRNDGAMMFTDVAEEAGVAVAELGSSGVVACDLNNDGFQDLYVGGRGVDGDGLTFARRDRRKSCVRHTPTGS